VYRELAAVVLRDAIHLGHPLHSRSAHLDAVMEWLCRAQDAAGGGGVAYGYALRKTTIDPRRAGWLPPYPETTGYIIPTFLDYFRLTGREEFRTRAIEMARWEIEVQMDSGAVLAGPLGLPPAPAIFNTGQVLFGWVAAFEETGDETFLAAAIRAADYLVDHQDDGVWELGSPYSHHSAHTYDARVAWGLLEVARVTQQPAHREAAIRNLDMAVEKQAGNGWFADCCLTDHDRPLLHTLAYTAESLLAAGGILDEAAYSEAARSTAEALLVAQRPDGSLAGRFDSEWRSAVAWSCLTGSAQTAVIWLRLFERTGDARYFDAARRANQQLCGTQDISSNRPGIRGGIKGSHPVWSRYLSFVYINWAAKFFADALMLDQRLEGLRSQAAAPTIGPEEAATTPVLAG
jgi:hypothetical protein